MKLQHLLPAVAFAVACTVASPARAQSRGELLYGTHCLACHSEQMHWRDKKQAVDWPSLRAQVRLWQATGQLSWDEDDITQVTRYLNDRFYRFANPDAPTTTGRAPPLRGTPGHS